MKKILKTLNITISLLLILTAAAIAYIALPVFGNQALIVRSGSMMPTIDVGSIVVTRNAQNYNKGDVIAFKTEKGSKTIVTHRITEIETGKDGTFYQTKGDANDNVDGWSVDKQNVLGKVYFTIPYVGQILAFAKTKLGMSLLIVLPAIVVILLEVFNIIKEISKKRRSRHPERSISAAEGSHTTNVRYFARAQYDNLKTNSKLNIFGFKIIIPVIIAIGLSVPIAYAFLNDTETSTDNIIAAANSFGTPTVTQTPTPTPTPTTEPARLVINEVYYRVAQEHRLGSEADSEWAELYNGGGSPITLSAIALEDNTQCDDITGPITIPAGAFAIVSTHTETEFRSIWTSVPQGTIFLTGPAAIGNGLANNDELMLRDGTCASGTIIDHISWGSNIDGLNPSIPSVPSDGISSERNPDGVDTDTNADFIQSNPPTPGT